MTFDVYMLHFSEPVRGKRHYIGIANSNRLARRLEEHVRGEAANLTAQAVNQGATLHVVRIWRDRDFAFERRLKNRKNARFLCGLCSPSFDTTDHIDHVLTDTRKAKPPRMAVLGGFNVSTIAD